MSALSLGHLLALNDERFSDAQDHARGEECDYRKSLLKQYQFNGYEVEAMRSIIMPEIRVLEGRDTPVACEQDRLELLRGISAKLEGDGE